MSNWDVFISYSHIDNMNGWVDKFYTRLYMELSAQLGRKVKIFQYERHQPGNAKKLMPDIHENLQKSTILIPILSPSYQNSATSQEELKTFKNQKNNDDHIFPVAKAPIEFDDMIVSFKLYKDDAKEENIENEITGGRKIDPDNDKKEFDNIIEKLSIKIAQFIERSTETNKDSPLIYLAEPSPDMTAEYKEIKSDLQQRKCNFIPLEINPFKPPDSEEFKEEIRKDIQKCKLTVQLVGEKNNLYPQGSFESYLQLQNEVAAERDGESDFKRLIWLPKYRLRNDADPEDFIKPILNITSKNVEVIQNPSIEDFKTQIQDNLEALKPKPKLPIPVPSDEYPFVYLIYDRSDSETVDKLGDSIHTETGFGIWGSDTYFDPSLNGSERTESHDFLLQTCRAVVIYWCSAPPRWLMQSISDVQRVTASRDKKARAKAVFIDNKGSRFTPPGDLLPINGYPELPNFLSLLEVQS